jgi:RimJ/RimL family protein N-acetyltransferase
VVETATITDFHRRLAAGADPDAQRWLGWDDETMRQARAAVAAGCLRQPRKPANPVAWPRTWSLITMSARQEFVASAVVYRYGSHSDRAPLGPRFLEWQVGLIVAPGWRGRGLGARLFALAATYAHGVLGLETIGAGCDPANLAAVRALTRARFVPGSGPNRRRLADGRVVPATWFERTRDPL